MIDHSQDNRRLAKNTLFLYFRMFLIMGVTFFSFRILLSQLGEQGYGSYNAVSGIIVIFSFLSSALNQSTQRFLSFYIGKGDNDTLTQVFSMCINIHILICIILIILSETIGYWFLKTYMKFPITTFGQIQILYQLTILTFCFQIMMVPFQASIISHERMSFYAYFSIIEAILKLAAVSILIFFPTNKLIVYGLSLCIISCVILIIYHWYCKKYFSICRYHFNKDFYLFKEISSFSGWNMLGGIGNVAATQGINMLFNVFMGVLVNAALGVANQVAAAVSSFVSNFQTAFNPQLIKSYANREYSYFFDLIFKSSRYSFLLIFLLGFPIALCCPFVLRIWLGEYPTLAVPFTRLIIIFCMVDALSGPLWTAAQATGNIKGYMIIISSLILSNIPVALLLLWFGYSPIWVMIYKVAINIIIHFTRIIYLYHLIVFPVWKYIKDVMLRVLLFISLTLPLPILLYSQSASFYNTIISMGIAIIITACVGWLIILNRNEKAFFLSIVLSKLRIK